MGLEKKQNQKEFVANEVSYLELNHPELDRAKNLKLDIQQVYRFISAQSVALEYFRYCKDGLWGIMVQNVMLQIPRARNQKEKRQAEKLLKDNIKKAKIQIDSFEKKIEALMSNFESNGEYQELVDSAIDLLTDVLESIKYEPKEDNK